MYVCITSRYLYIGYARVSQTSSQIIRDVTTDRIPFAVFPVVNEYAVLVAGATS